MKHCLSTAGPAIRSFNSVKIKIIRVNVKITKNINTSININTNIVDILSKLLKT